MDENTKRINDVYDYLIYKHVINGQEDMAKALKTSRPNITSMLSGKKSVSTETFRKISEAFPNIFSLNWLLTGTPPMFIDDPFKTGSAHETDKTLDKSSLINAALAAKDDAIESLKRELRTKDEIIQALRDQLADKDQIIAEQKARLIDYRRIIDSRASLSDYPFPVGAADGDKRARLTK